MPPPVPTLREYFARWQIQHHAPDLDPATTTFLRLFLTFTYACAKPLARRRIPPDAVTVFGLVWAVIAVAVVGVSPGLAAGFVLVSAVTDGIDGCVAALTDRATRFGYVLDSLVDRMSDGLFVLALVRAGGEPALAVAAASSLMALEYTRARAGAGGLEEIGVVTVGERPTRIIATVLGLAGAQVTASRPWFGPNPGLTVTAVAAVVGTAQLVRHLRRTWPD